MLVSGTIKAPETLDDLLGPALLARLDRLDLGSKRLFAGKLPGERRGKRRGRSVEFDDFRPYTKGDDLRHIDWNLYARLDRLIVKIFLEEQDLSLHLAIDASASMGAGGGSKCAMAMRLAGALAAIGLASRDRVAVSVFGTGAPAHSGAYRGRTNLPALARFILARAKAVEPGTPAERFEDSMKSVVSARTGKGVMVVLSDFLQPEGCEGGLRTLAAGGGFDVHLLQVLAAGEIDPALERDTSSQRGLAGDLRLVDAETGLGKEVTVSAALIERYKARLTEHIDTLASAAAARDMSHTLLRSDADVVKVVGERLRGVGVVR